MKVLPLVGYKSLKAFYAFNTLVLGFKMLPAYIAQGDYETFLASFGTKTDAEKEKVLREAAKFVQLTQEEVEALAAFATDKNGIPYSAVNIGNLNPVQLHEIIVAVAMEIGRISISVVSEEEKKNSLPSA